MPINNAHFVIEGFKERIPIKQWRAMLLNEEDTIVFRGHVRKLIGKNLGCGVIEISKEPKGE
jgi:hypothetical protein